MKIKNVHYDAEQDILYLRSFFPDEVHPPLTWDADGEIRDLSTAPSPR